MPNRKWLLKGSNQPHGTHINNLNLYSGEYKLVAYRQNFASVQFTSVAQSCLTLCKPMNHSMSGLPVHHQLPESTQTHVLCVGDAIQPSHPLSSPSPPAVNLSQHQVFSNESALRIKWPKYWSFSFNISPFHQVAKVFGASASVLLMNIQG